MRLETKAIGSVTKADVEAIREGRREALAASQKALDEATRRAEAGEAVSPELVAAGRLAARSGKSGEVSTNRMLRRLQHLFNWAIGEGYCNETPFKRNGVLVVRLNGNAEGARSRRLEGDEEARLLSAAGEHLRGLIIAALESGCRLGELTSLQWEQFDLANSAIFLPAAKTKTAEDRAVPITARLRAVLEMRFAALHTAMNRNRAAGEPEVKVSGTAYVFGNEVGEQVNSIKTAWRLTCRRAGIVNLHFHDLRRECGSRLLETPGVPLVAVRDWLGHKSIDMTNVYLSSTLQKLQDVRAKVDRAAQKAAKAEGRKRRTNVAHGNAQPMTASPSPHIC